MAVTTKIEPIADFIEVALREDLSPQAKSKALAGFAKEKLAEAQDTNRAILGRVPPHKVFVDGRQGANLESVNAQNGVIIFEFELMTDVLRWIGQTLIDRSPSVSGDYKRGHTFFADGKEIPLGGQIPPAEEYSFTNLVPYARKIEIGKTKSGRSFVMQVPNRIYERTAKDARASFGNMAKIEFTYRGIVAGAQVNPIKSGAAKFQQRDRKTGRFMSTGGPQPHNVSAVRYPTIVVTQPRG